MTLSPYIYPDGRLDTKNASVYVGLSTKTLAQLRCLGKGPRFVKPTGGRIFYYKDDLDAWINRRGLVISTSEAFLSRAIC